jgi:intein-encoded DNA endonuclease-like protein
MKNFTKIKGYENYSINNIGTILNKKKKILYNSKNKYGYEVTLCKDGKSKTFRIHRLVYENFIGEIPIRHCVVHIDGNNYNNFYKNLKLSTHKEYLKRTLTDYEISLVLSKYKDKNSLLDISKIIHTKPQEISKILKNNSIKIRTSRHVDFLEYSLNHNYFNIIDSPEKSYLLGLLFADGCVSYENNTINLVSNDLDLIEFFRESIKCNKDIYKNPNHKLAYTFSFCSPKIKNDLINLGCVPRKSLILEFPNYNQVPEKVMSHFIRGYFDGDGSMYVTSKINQCKIMSSTKFCIGLVKYLKYKFNFDLKLMHDKNLKKETSYIRITNKKKLYIFRDFLYDNDIMSLKRKKDKFYSY